MSNAQRFERYLRDFCKDHDLSEEEALNNAMVKIYKVWIEKELDNDDRAEKTISEKI